MAQVKTPAQIAAMFGCSVEQARAQLLANAQQMAGMAAKARAAGKRLRGYTAEQLEANAAAYAAAAAA